MTKLTPEFIAFRDKMAVERADWPAELVTAATKLSMELEFSRLRNWSKNKGPEKLKEYHDEFQRLYAEHKAKSAVRDVQ